MVQTSPSRRFAWQRPTALLVVLLFVAFVAAWQSSALAQELPAHRLYRGDMPTGIIGRAQALRPGRAGYFQPVELKTPEGAKISVCEDGRYGEAQETRALVGFLIGPVYYLKVTNIPLNEGVEIFPTIELLDRLCPPAGEELRFPIPIELTLEELDLAAQGKFITRVIYLEDPQAALGVRQDPDRQRYFEVDRGTDVLEMADRLGRPMAILRMGSRVTTEQDFIEGNVRPAAYMRYPFPAAPAPQRLVVPPGQDLPVSDFHEHVPRVEPDQKWTIIPTYVFPQDRSPYAPPRR
jgi:hypothetical protein